MKRGPGPKRKTALKPKRPKTRLPKPGDGSHVGFRFLVLAKNRGRCAWPKCGARAADAHHVVYKQHCPDGRKHDASDGIPLCHGHHWTQHYGNERLPLRALLPENIEFAKEVLGDRAMDYLRRRYASDEQEAA